MIYLLNRSKRERLVEKIDTHLRQTARQLIKFNTLNETLNYLIESFWKQFNCDYVSILLKDSEHLYNRYKKGHSPYFELNFPMELQTITQPFFIRPICNYDISEETEYCALLQSIESEQYPAWFTVPINEGASESYGVCIIGFRTPIQLFTETGNLFIEFGNDIAVAIDLALHKEKEKRKIKGIEWVKDNLYLGESTESLIQGIVEQAGNGTNADSACVYLYDEWNHCLVYQPPTFGSMEVPIVIDMRDTFHLSDFFHWLEKEGGQELTVPLVVNLKTIGVLHVAKKQKEQLFDNEDLNFLRLLSSHVSVLIENARLYGNEKKDKSRLEQMMVNHQELVKQTLVGEGFSGLTETLSYLLNCSVILLDRFMRPIASFLIKGDERHWPAICNLLDREREQGQGLPLPEEQWVSINHRDSLGIWKINGGGENLGFLCLLIAKNELDMVHRITINQALNVYAIQFIKQKLVLEVTEQVKGSFLDELFSEKIKDKKKIIEYCNLFNMNLIQPHKVGVFTIQTRQEAWILQQLRDHFTRWDEKLVLARKDGKYIIFVPEKKEVERPDYWKSIYERIKKLIVTDLKQENVFLGISHTAYKMEDYYKCYKQALQTLRIVSDRFPQKGFMSFDRMGSYSVLYNIQDPFVVEMFYEKYLKPLLDYGDKGKDLFDTLRSYLYWNGNLKETADSLFIHRSSLRYRLEKIEELLKIELTNAEERFNIMLAYKLYDLYAR